jgi:hypothetical protein
MKQPSHCLLGEAGILTRQLDPLRKLVAELSWRCVHFFSLLLPIAKHYVWKTARLLSLDIFELISNPNRLNPIWHGSNRRNKA